MLIPDRTQVDNQLTVGRCCGCNTLRLATEIPDESGPSLISAFDPHHSNTARRGLTEFACAMFRPITLSWKRRRVTRHLPAQGLVLEIGCGTGEMASELVKRGYEVVAVEPDERARQYATKHFDLKVVPTVEGIDGGFSSAVLWHVLEHVDSPVAFLRKIGSLLAPDGVLVLAVPNAASLDAAMYSESWIAWDGPRHIWHFEPETLDRTLQAAGFEIIGRDSVPSDTLFNCAASEILDLNQPRWNLPFRMVRAIARSIRVLHATSRPGPNTASTLMMVARVSSD